VAASSAVPVWLVMVPSKIWVLPAGAVMLGLKQVQRKRICARHAKSQGNGGKTI
jgi:hypothetical protein